MNTTSFLLLPSNLPLPPLGECSSTHTHSHTYLNMVAKSQTGPPNFSLPFASPGDFDRDITRPNPFPTLSNADITKIVDQKGFSYQTP